MDKAGKTQIGLKSDRDLGELIFCNGSTIACFQAEGKVDEVKQKFIKWTRCGRIRGSIVTINEIGMVSHHTALDLIE